MTLNPFTASSARRDPAGDDRRATNRRGALLAGAFGLGLGVVVSVVGGITTTHADAAATVRITPREYHNVFTVPANSSGQVYSTSCPSGQLATGGGYAQLYFSTTIVVGSSEPISSGNAPSQTLGWAVIVDNHDSQPHNLFVYAVCTPAH